MWTEQLAQWSGGIQGEFAKPANILVVSAHWEEAPLAESVAASIDEFAAAYAGGEPQRVIGAYLAARAKR